MSRWRTLSIWSVNGGPAEMLLEDAHDLAVMLESTGRTVPRSDWVAEAREYADRMRTEESLEGLI